MKLFSKEVDKQLFAQYPKGSNLENQMVVAKIFNPYGRGVWYLLNSDPSDPDYIWAIVDLFEPEMGSVSRSELQTIKVPPFGLGLERDIYFTPKPAKEVWQGVSRGERFAKGGKIVGYEVEYEKLVGGERERDIKTFETKEEAEQFAKENYGYVENVYEGQYEYAKGGEVEDKINKLYVKSNFINDDFNWKLKLLEMLQDGSNEAYHIYQSLTKKQKEDVLQELFEMDNDFGSEGDGEIETSRENLEILLEDAKEGKNYAKGGEITPYIVWVSKDGNKRELYGEYKSMRAADMQMKKLWEKGEYKSMGNKSKSRYEKEGFYAEGGEVRIPKEGDDVKGFGHKYLTPIIEVNEKNNTFKIDNPNYWDFGDVLISFDKVFYSENDDAWVKKMAMGGEVKFADKVKAVEKSLLKRKKVAPIVQKDYGKTYDKKEAHASALRIIGAQTAKWKERNKK